MSAFLDILQKYALTRKVNLNEDKISKDLAIVEKATKEVEIRKSHDYEQQISVEIIAEPESPDAHGHWYSKATIEKGFLSADTRWRKGELPMNLCHSYDDIKGEYVSLVKHYLVPFDCEINGQKVKEGTWCAEVKWHNTELWKKRTTILEDGTTEFAGLSLRGWGKINDPKVNND